MTALLHRLRVLAWLALPGLAFCAAARGDALPDRWIGTWAAAPQPAFPGRPERYDDRTLRLVVHVSAGGRRVRIRLSNTYGRSPLRISAAHVALRRGERP
jgi:hypothetical protein